MIDPDDRLVLEKIAAGGFRTNDDEVHYQLARRTRAPMPALEVAELLEIIAELEAAGLVATALEIRLTDAGRAELDLPARPPVRYSEAISSTTTGPPYPRRSSNGRARPRRALHEVPGRIGPRRTAA